MGDNTSGSFESSVPFYYDEQQFSRGRPLPILACPFGGQQSTLVFAPGRVAHGEHHSFVSTLNDFKHVWPSPFFYRGFWWKDYFCVALGLPTALRDQAQRKGLCLWVGALFPRASLPAELLAAFINLYFATLNTLFAIHLPDSGAEEFIRRLNEAEEPKSVGEAFGKLLTLMISASALAGTAGAIRHRRLLSSLKRRLFSRLTSKRSESVVLLSPNQAVRTALDFFLQEIEEGTMAIVGRQDELHSEGKLEKNGMTSNITVVGWPSQLVEPRRVSLKRVGRSWYIRLS
jgi:hypothetical protein